MTIREFVALTQRELLKWLRAPIGIVSSLMLPFFYLLLFGQSLNLGKLLSIGGVPPQEAAAIYLGAPDYFSYFSVGMVGFIMLFTGLFAGANVIFARRFGTLKKETAAPVPREVIFGSRVTAGVIRGVVFGSVVFAIAIGFAHLPGLNGLTITGNSGIVGVIEIILAMGLVTALFSSIFIGLGFVTEQIESYFALVNLVNLPVSVLLERAVPHEPLPPLAAEHRGVEPGFPGGGRDARERLRVGGVLSVQPAPIPGAVGGPHAGVPRAVRRRRPMVPEAPVSAARAR